MTGLAVVDGGLVQIDGGFEREDGLQVRRLLDGGFLACCSEPTILRGLSSQL